MDLFDVNWGETQHKYLGEDVISQADIDKIKSYITEYGMIGTSSSSFRPKYDFNHDNAMDDQDLTLLTRAEEAYFSYETVTVRDKTRTAYNPIGQLKHYEDSVVNIDTAPGIVTDVTMDIAGYDDKGRMLEYTEVSYEHMAQDYTGELELDITRTTHRIISYTVADGENVLGLMTGYTDVITGTDKPGVTTNVNLNNITYDKSGRMKEYTTSSHEVSSNALTFDGADDYA